MARVGVLDLGTNTFRLLIASGTKGSTLKRERIERQIVRVGQGAAAQGAISQASAQRAQAALRDFSSVLQQYDLNQVAGMATGVFRDAANSDKVLHDLSAACAIPIRLIGGDQEGDYTLKGVLQGLDLSGHGDSLIVDIGGGSTELIRVRAKEKPRIQSLPVGVVYLKERTPFGSGPDRHGLEELKQRIRSTLEGARPIIEGCSFCVGTGGTMTTLSYMGLGLSRYEPEKIHGDLLTRGQVDRLLAEALRSSPEELQRAYHLEKGRADLVLYGAALVHEILLLLGERSIRISDYGLLEGKALEMLQGL